MEVCSIAAGDLVRTGRTREAEAALRSGLSVRALLRKLYGVTAAPEWDAAHPHERSWPPIRPVTSSSHWSDAGAPRLQIAATLRMLLLQGGLLDVPAASRCRKHPFAFRRRPPRFQDGRRPLCQRDRAPCVLGFAERDVNRAVLNVFPPQAEALFRPQPKSIRIVVASRSR